MNIESFWSDIIGIMLIICAYEVTGVNEFKTGKYKNLKLLAMLLIIGQLVKYGLLIIKMN